MNYQPAPLAAPEETRASLQLVVREVVAELNEARAALEVFADNNGDRGALHRCVAHVHLARGALRLAEVYGGALLGEEMEQVAGYVDAHGSDGKVDADALDALMRAMEQLPAYVDRVASGGRDVPLALLPLLNDLRAVRGGSLLSEGTLLLLNLRSDEPAHPAVDATGAAGAPVADLARKLRPRFQVALLGWIRGEHVEQNLAVLADIAAQFEQAAAAQPLFQLWWVAGAVLEALQQGGIDGNVSVKRLLGHVDRELRRMQEHGEARWSDAPPVELLNNLLFYVARSSSAGPRVDAVRRSFRLDEVLAVDEQVDEARETLSAPSVRLMKTVAAAIREDLTRVKDVLDIFVRKGATQVDELVPQLEMLRKISDTLGVLGLGALRDRVQGEIESLKVIVDRREPPGDAALLGIASALIEVEDSLDSQLVKLILPDAAPAGAADGEPADEEFRLVQDAVLRECIVNMARIKEAITQALGAPAEAQGLDQVPQLVRGITAGLLMLGKQRAVEAMERVGRALAGIVRPDPGAFALPRLDRLADAIVAVEYYMEMLQAGRAEPWHMLENAENRLEEIEQAPSKIVALRPSRPAEGEAAPTEMPAEAGAEPFEPAAAPVQAAPAEVESGRPPEPAAIPAAAVPVDAEFLALFAEEARENITQLGVHFPQWESNPLDLQALKDVRRVFHTLKGSGRMVGARRVSEFSWSIESLLNRVISQTLSRTPEIVDVVRDAVAALPALVDELEQGGEAAVDVNAIVARADAISGRDAAAVPPAAVAPAPTPAPEPAAVEVAEVVAETPETMDPVLHDIFRKETAGHVGVVRDFIARSSESVAPYAVTEALYRACHTLSGIAKTAGVRQGIKVAEPMEHYVRKLHDNGRGLPEEGLLLLRDTVRSLENVVEHVEEDTGYFPDHGRLIAGWHALERSLDAELSRLAEAGERTVAEALRGEEDLGSPAEEFTQPSLATLEAPEEPAPAETSAAEELTEPHLLMPELPAGMAVPTEVHLPAEAPPVLEPAVTAEEETSGEPGFDADIAAIFSEEATELLEVAEASLGSWSRDRADRARVTELKRVLHTLKGGARMAGIRAMGDLSHEMESFLASLEAGQVASESAAIEVLQASLDELHRMRELANAGQPIPLARELIERVHALAAAPAPAEAVADAAVEPTQPAGQAASEELPVEVLPAEEIVLESPPAELGSEEAEAPAEPVEAQFEAVEALPEAPVEVPVEALPETPVEAAPEPAWLETEEPAPAAVVAAPVFEPVPAPPAWTPEPLETAAHASPFVLPGREPVTPTERHDLARVSAELLDELLNNAGEVSIFRARVEQQMTSIEFNLAELGRTVTRLREQLRKLELETEAQILFKHQGDAEERADFDPLELDRYSTIQQLSRALAESVSDVASIESLLENQNREGQNLLQQQGRVIGDLQNGLMRTRMVPFQRHAQRLTRLTRQAAQETGKKVELEIEGASGEIDRQVLERMLPPFEHMLRNAVVHGIELPEDRLAAGKAETGRIAVRLQREGAEVVIVVEDDGAGLNIEAIRAKARQMGLLAPDQQLTDEESLQLILEPGFSTADRLTQQAGRGVGMDVVATEVKKLGGGLYIESTPGRGARFTIRLPFTLAITQALIVRVHDEFYALPVATVEGVARLPSSEVRQHLVEEQPTFEYGGHVYRFQHLGAFLGSGASALPETDAALPVILVRAGEHSTALVTDELVGSREIVVKSVGPQVASVRGISGATILGDGRIVIILDMGALVRSEWRSRAPDVSVRPTRDERIFVMVVDDSITVRRVTQRLLERNGMRVITAKDGVDAMALLQEHTPDVILLDIEMPRMDGYEVAAHVRNDSRLADVPVIMITSRVGDKHRARAIELGVDDYLGKPYQESQLLDAIEPLVLARRRQAT
jgi:chemosensory pili system protein ChpA (sensor histidine kinase/response regulator)